jgi:diguanylate cyclase (GGDEF)-like protein/PAS domain S-box-containing protein
VSPRSIKRLLLVEDSAGDGDALPEILRGLDRQQTEVIFVGNLSEVQRQLVGRCLGSSTFEGDLPPYPDGCGQEAGPLGEVPAEDEGGGTSSSAVSTGAAGDATAGDPAKDKVETVELLRVVRHQVERRMMEDALIHEKDRAEATLNCIADAVVCADMAGGITFVNAIAESMTACSRQDSLGRAVGQVVRILDGTTRASVQYPTWVHAEEHPATSLAPNAVLVRPDGAEIPIEGSMAPIRDRKGHVTGTVIVFRDSSAARATALQITHSAQHDFLTGLPNRMLIHDRVGQAIALSHRHRKKVAVLFLDLDGFKAINDSLGHRFGDRLLQSVATRLVGCVRGSDSVSRQGGDEFVALLAEVEHAEDAAITARRMLQAVAEVHFVEGHSLCVTASIGVSVYPDDGLDAETLIKNADTAMYQAKENGRHGYTCFKPAMNARALERQFIEEGLRRALEGKEFLLHYQPKVCLKTGEITGAEALLRWVHPTRGAISPAQFIPVAEDCSLIRAIDKWVLREACQQARAWADAGLPPITMAVNTSAVDLRGEGFLEGVFRILDDTGLEPEVLELELTETALMERTDTTESLLRTLRAKGVQLVVDNFGAGYSSLSYLREFTVDSLKLDRSFLRQVAAIGKKAAIAAAVIEMGRSLNLRVVAGGVEQPEEVAFLQDQDCDEAQGYYFSQPMLPQQFAKILQSGFPARGAEQWRDPTFIAPN